MMPSSNTNRGRRRGHTNQNRNNNSNGRGSRDNDYITVNPPKQKNIKLPFFAYGIFKPGQLAYSRISEFVKKQIF